MITGYFLLGYTGFVIVWDWWGYGRCPDRRSKFLSLLTFQIYKVPAILIRLIGMGRAYFVYLPNYKAKPTIPMLEREYKNAARAASGTRKCPVWIDKSHPIFGPYYLHYDPKRPTEVLEEPEGPAEEPIPMPRPTALAPGSVGSDGTSITSITMEPYEPTGEKNAPYYRLPPPPTQSQPQPPAPERSDSVSLSSDLSDEEKSSTTMSRSWLTGIPEVQNEGSSGVRTPSRGGSAVTSMSDDSEDSAILSVDRVQQSSGSGTGSDPEPYKKMSKTKTGSISGSKKSKSKLVSSNKSLGSKSSLSLRSSDSSGAMSEALRRSDSEIPSSEQ